MTAMRRSLSVLLAVAGSAIAVVATAAPAVAVTPPKHKGFTVKVSSGTITMTFSSSVWSTLDSGTPTLGRVTAPIAPATSATPGVFVFPISHGSLNSATGHGTVAAKGGISTEDHVDISGLFESVTSATAAEPAAVLGTSSTLTMVSSNFTPPKVALFTLVLTHVKPAGTRHSVTLKSIPVRLTQAGVDLFGSTFKTGQQVAKATILAKG